MPSLAHQCDRTLAALLTNLYGRIERDGQEPITRAGASKSHTRPMSRRFHGTVYF